MRRDRTPPRRALNAARPAGLTRRVAIGALGALVVVPAAGCRRVRPPVSARFSQFSTLVDITIWNASRLEAERAIADLRRAYAQLDRDWYAWGDGELGRLNTALERRVDVPVSSALGDLLHHALTLSAASGGRFDVRVGPLVALWGLPGSGSAPAPDALPAEADIAAALARARLHLEVVRRGADWRVRTEAAGVLVDLGGVAKGAVLSRGLALLRRAGITRALIDAGGDLAGYDDAGEAGFRIGIRPARRGGPVRALALGSGEAVTTSGDYARYRDIGGRRFAHIVDPRTGWPAERARSATVVHRDAARADAAATALIVGGAAEFDAVCDAMRVESALLVDNRGEMRATTEMRARLDTGPAA